MTEITRDDLLTELVHQYESISSMQGMLNAVCELLDGEPGFEVAAIIEGGIPEQHGALRKFIRDAGGEVDEDRAWLGFCRGYQVVVSLRDMDTQTEVLKSHPVEWLRERWAERAAS